VRNHSLHEAASRPNHRSRQARFTAQALSFLLFAILLAVSTIARAQATAPPEPINPAASIPSAPLPIIKNQKQGPCRVIPRSESSGRTITALGSSYLAASAGFPPVEQAIHPAASQTYAEDVKNLPACQPPPLVNFYQRFINGPEVKPLTPKEKARLAVRNVLDPFNAITIGASAASAIGSDSHSAYGPGIPGFWRYTGVSYTEDLTSEFFGTFLVPSIFHQDPHYHRMPHSPIPRRILNAIIQVGWTKSDSGKGIPNYSSLIAAPIDAEIANLYVPGIETDLPSSAARVVTGYALAPTDNFVTEFLPDVARHIHVQIVFVQQLINQVSNPGGPNIF
jgi:hypothetical protein